MVKSSRPSSPCTNFKPKPPVYVLYFMEHINVLKFCFHFRWQLETPDFSSSAPASSQWEKQANAMPRISSEMLFIAARSSCYGKYFPACFETPPAHGVIAAPSYPVTQDWHVMLWSPAGSERKPLHFLLPEISKIVIYCCLPVLGFC